MSRYWMKLQTLKKGDFYIDCAYHPCLVTVCSGDTLEGVSLIDGSSPRSCSISHCGPERITMKNALKKRENWEIFQEEMHQLGIKYYEKRPELKKEYSAYLKGHKKENLRNKKQPISVILGAIKKSGMIRCFNSLSKRMKD